MVNCRRLQQQRQTFNQGNYSNFLNAPNLTELFRLEGRFYLDGIAHNEHINSAKSNIWTYIIAERFQISPREVETWDFDEYMETLAYIHLMNTSKK